MIVQCKSGKANQRGPLVMWLNQPLYIPLEQILLRWATPRPMRILFESIPSPKDIRPHHLKHVSRGIMIHEPFRVMLFDLCKFEQHKSTHTREHFKTHCIKLKTFTFHLVSHRWIPLTKGQQREKCFHFFHLMKLSWIIWLVQQRVNQLYFLYWNGNVSILIKLLSLTAPDVVKHDKLHCSQWWKIHQHDAVIKWKHFPRYWPFVRGIHRSPVNSPHKGQWRGALMFSLIYAE